jgi:4-hydroxybenzoate polyprenyltransferase
VVYKQPDLCSSHETKLMTPIDQMPEAETPDPKGQVADAPRGNWVDRVAPEFTRPYLRLSRADRPIGTWLLLLPCWWGVSLAAAMDGWRMWDLWIIVGCAFGAWLMRGAGCTWNDITDRDFDASVARTRSRPIPSGQITVRQAIVWMFLQVLIAALVLFSYNRATILLGIGSLGLVAIYPYAKRFTWWPQIFLGLAFNWGAMLAFAAHAGRPLWPAVLLYLSGIAWTLFYDTIYAHQDKEDDVLIGVKSTARLFGERTGQWLALFLALTVVLMALAILTALLPTAGPTKLVLALAAPWLMGWHLLWQMRKLDISDPSNCLRIFRANRDTGLIATLFIAAAAFL